MQRGMLTCEMGVSVCIRVMEAFPIKYYFGRQVDEIF